MLTPEECSAFDSYMDIMLRNNESENLGLSLEDIVKEWHATYRTIFLNRFQP
jgi:hypothetical protein